MLKKPRKILFIRSGAIGDVLMTTPLIRAIRKKFPESHISYLVGEWSKGVLKNNDDIDKVISFDDRIIYKKKFIGVLKLIKKIRKKKFDMCFILDKSYLFNLFVYFCGISDRIGFDRKGEGFPNTESVFFDGTKHELEYYLDLARILGITKFDDKMIFKVNSIEEKYANDFIKKYNLKKIIGIAPGGAKNPGQEIPLKRYPKEKYVKLIKSLLQKNYSIVLFGGKGDKAIGKYIVNKIQEKGILNIIGKTTLGESVSLMSKCNYFITHDSGPMHLAASSGTKVIALFGPTPARRFAPKNSIVLQQELNCEPCYTIKGKFKKCDDNMCMDIDVEKILKSLN